MVEIKNCKRCGHIWTPRSEEEPIACPACKSYQYKIPLKKEKYDGLTLEDKGKQMLKESKKQ